MTAPSAQSLHTKHKRNPTTREKCAAGTGCSHTTLDKVDQVQHLADDTTASAELRALAAEALREMDTTGKVDGPYQRVMAAADPDGWRRRRGRQLVAKVRTIVWTRTSFSGRERPSTPTPFAAFQRNAL
jgi:hypothetical protein